MNTATLKNLLPNTKIKLADENLVLILSIFYNHPQLLAEDGWKLIKVGSENVLIDTDTAHVTNGKEIELVWDKDHITHIKLTSKLQGDALMKHWEEMLQYAGNVQRDMTAHFDKNKVDDLCAALEDVKVSTSAENSEKNLEQQKTLPTATQSPLKSIS